MESSGKGVCKGSGLNDLCQASEPLRDVGECVEEGHVANYFS